MWDNEKYRDEEFTENNTPLPVFLQNRFWHRSLLTRIPQMRKGGTDVISEIRRIPNPWSATWSWARLAGPQLLSRWRPWFTKMLHLGYWMTVLPYVSPTEETRGQEGGIKKPIWEFSGNPVVKTHTSIPRDTGSIPGRELRPHILCSVAK